MMAPFVYEEARANAPLHAQLCRCRLTPLAADATSVRVTGRVLRIFRNRGGSLYLGQKINFYIPVTGPADLAPQLDGTIRHHRDRIGRARFLEAFLDYWDGEFHLVHSQVAPIRCPTWRPICGPDTNGFLCKGHF
jgi:hypothetical protein